MFNLPLHPAMVHLPLGIAFIIPLLALIIFFGIQKGWFQSRTWLIVVVLNALLFGSALLALNTGGQEEEKVEKVVSENAIENHEEKAEVFVWASGIALILTAGAGFLQNKPFSSLAQGIATLGLFGVMGLAIPTGHSGGELVYKHGASQAYASSIQQKQEGTTPESGPAIENNKNKKEDDD